MARKVFSLGQTKQNLALLFGNYSSPHPELPIGHTVNHIVAAVTPSPLRHDVLDNTNTNLTNSQKELLQWHFKLGHINLRWIQQLFRVRKGAQEP